MFFYYLNHYVGLLIIFILFGWLILDLLVDSIIELFISKIIKNNSHRINIIYNFFLWLNNNWKIKIFLFSYYQFFYVKIFDT